jgi:hypothetical protein
MNAVHVVFRIVDILRQWLNRGGYKSSEHAYSECARLVHLITTTSMVDGKTYAYVAAAMNAGAYARALQATESIARDISKTDGARLARVYYTIQQLYTRLDERDGVSGALECIRQIRAPIARERILAYESAGNYNDALPFHQVCAGARVFTAARSVFG